MNNWAYNTLRSLYNRLFVIRKANYCHRRIIRKIKNKGFANVVFFAANLPMWRYQGVYDLMRQDHRFRLTILITPFKSFSEAQKIKDIKILKDFFDSRNIPYEDTTTWPAEKFAIRKWLDPDIMFYCQQYQRILGNPLDNNNFFDKLLCYAPYGVGTVTEPWAVNSRFQNVAWRLFYETEVYRKVAQQLSFGRGKNVVVVGNTNADAFLQAEHKNPWKEQSHSKKRVIWAPHFSILPDMELNRSGFLWLNDFMLNIAQEYSETIQFAFKPHPRLKSILYNCPEWGKERTDKYYEKWETMPNTQLEEGSFYDLFMTSDAMIHDCASFTVEYHYSQKPCLFTSHDIQSAREPLNELGRAALDAHYWGNSDSDVRLFIENTVLAGNDPKEAERRDFFNKYLLPPNGKTVAQNIFDNIVQSIWK